MKTSCLSWVAVYVLLALGLAAWFFLRFPATPTMPPSLPEPSFRLKVALAAGLLGALPVLFALSTLYTAGLRMQERARLGRASEGGLPADGEQGVFYGPIHRDGPPLTSPLGQRDCLLYKYKISHLRTQKLKRPGPASMKVETSDTIVDAEGFALTPSTIQTAGGPVKLLTLVRPEFTANRLSRDEAIKSYEAFAATAALRGEGGLDANPDLQRTVLADTSGAVRYDLGTGELDPGEALLFEEHVVEHGENVVVFGKYSAALGGIVHDRDSVWETRLRKGSLESLRKGFVLNAIGYALGAAAWCMVAVAGAWAFFKFGPTHIWD